MTFTMPKTYRVRSQTDKDTIYNVAIYSDGYATCECIYYLYKGYKIGQGSCKHIQFILDKHYQKGGEKL